MKPGARRRPPRTARAATAAPAGSAGLRHAAATRLSPVGAERLEAARSPRRTASVFGPQRGWSIADSQPAPGASRTRSRNGSAEVGVEERPEQQLVARSRARRRASGRPSGRAGRQARPGPGARGSRWRRPGRPTGSARSGDERDRRRSARATAGRARPARRRTTARWRSTASAGSSGRRGAGWPRRASPGVAVRRVAPVAGAAARDARSSSYRAREAGIGQPVVGDVDPFREIVRRRACDVGMVPLEQAPARAISTASALASNVQLEPRRRGRPRGASAGAASAHRYRRLGTVSRRCAVSR